MRRLAFAFNDHTIRIWESEPDGGKEIVRLELGAEVLCILSLPDVHLVAADRRGWLHWLEIVA
jgi:hypothetical protein